MIIIKKMDDTHWPEVKAIYEEGIKTGQATFETSAPHWEEWNKAHLEIGRLVALENGHVVGWAALTPVSSRCIYAGVAENSVYVLSEARGKGIGKLLLQRLIEESEKHHFWTIQAGIFPENLASVRLHEGAGFKIIGERQRIGQLNGVWRNNLLLERRSTKVGA